MVNVHVPCMMPRLALEEMLLQQGLHGLISAQRTLRRKLRR